MSIKILNITENFSVAVIESEEGVSGKNSTFALMGGETLTNTNNMGQRIVGS